METHVQSGSFTKSECGGVFRSLPTNNVQKCGDQALRNHRSEPGLPRPAPRFVPSSQTALKCGGAARSRHPFGPGQPRLAPVFESSVNHSGDREDFLSIRRDV